MLLIIAGSLIVSLRLGFASPDRRFRKFVRGCRRAPLSLAANPYGNHRNREGAKRDMDAADKVSVARSTILTQPKSVAPELAEAGFDLDTSPKGGIVAIGVHAHGPALHLDFSVVRAGLLRFSRSASLNPDAWLARMDSLQQLALATRQSVGRESCVTTFNKRYMPVIVGVSQITDTTTPAARARSPLELMVEASQLAAADAGPATALLSAIDSVAVIRSFSDTVPAFRSPFGRPENAPCRGLPRTPEESARVWRPGNPALYPPRLD